MTPPPAGAAGARAGAAASLDWRLQLAGRHMSDDLTGSLHGSEGGMSAALDTPVRPSYRLPQGGERGCACVLAFSGGTAAIAVPLMRKIRRCACPVF